MGPRPGEAVRGGSGRRAARFGRGTLPVWGLALLLPLLGGCSGRLAPEVGPERPPAFTVVPLGVSGGLRDGDLPSYLVATPGGSGMVLLDAGTIWNGLEAAGRAGTLSALGLPPEVAADPGRLLREKIPAVLVTHAHLDHCAGLVIDSPDDGDTVVFGLDETIDALRDHLFNGVIWANFGTEGAEPRLGKFRYARLEPGVRVAIPGTTLGLEALPLDHAGGRSTAFLLDAGDARVVYLGDTGPDAIEGGGRLAAVWERLAPLVRTGALRGLFVEVSFDGSRPDDQLFGHLTPRWLRSELHRLAILVDPEAPAAALTGLPVVVTHVKPVGGETFEATRRRILDELEADDDLGVQFVLPRQGEPLSL